jgi:hypothetical protein
LSSLQRKRNPQASWDGQKRGMAPFLELIALGLIVTGSVTAWLATALIRFVHPE